MFRPRRILVPVDLSSDTEAAVRAAAGLARDNGARLLLLHVFDVRAVEDVYNLHGLKKEEVLARPWLKGTKTTVKGVFGLPSEVIVAEAKAWKADLIVLAKRRRSGLSHLLYGRTSDGVVREAECAVLVLTP